MLQKLRQYRYLILFIIITAAAINDFLRFWGDWDNFTTAFVAHIYFGQAVYGYVRGGIMTIGPGALYKDDSPVGRAALAIAVLFGYILMFFFDGYDKY